MLQKYGSEVTSTLKGAEIELYKLTYYSRHPIADNKLFNLTLKHFEYLRDERLQKVKSGTVQVDLMLFRRVFKTAIRKWGYGLLSNPVENIQPPSSHKSRKRRLVSGEKERLLTDASLQRNKAGIADSQFHDLRHEAVSRFFEMAMSVPEVALISGYKDVRKLLRYTHLNPESLFNKYEAF